MSRKGTSSLLLVSLTALGLGAGCGLGGPLDPLDNVGGGTPTPPNPNVPTELSECSETVKAPCKITFGDLSFMEEASCGHKSDTTLAKTWNNPGGDTKRVQFGVDESSVMQTCNSYERKSCGMTFSAVPSLFKSMQASKIKLTLTEKHKLFMTTLTAGSTVTGSAVATATLQLGGKDALTIAGTRNSSGGGLELSQVTAWIVPGADRTIGLRINTDCGQVFSNNLPIFWSVEGMIAEMLP